MKARLVLMPAMIALLIVTTASGTGLATSTEVPGVCLPGTEPPPAGLVFKCYLPLILVGDAPPPPCTEELEVNDTHTDAMNIVSTRICGTASWDGDQDWYRVRLCSGPWDLRLALDGPDGSNLDLYLYSDPPGWPLYSSESSSADEVLTATALITGTYYVLVQPAWGSGPYELRLNIAHSH